MQQQSFLGVVGVLMFMWASSVAADVPKVKMATVKAAHAVRPQEMLQAVNRLRAQSRQCGRKHMPAVPALKWNDILATTARQHALDMAQQKFYKHTNQQGLEPFDRHKRAGYQGWGGVENITAGNETLTDALAHLMESPLHCETLMNGYITEMGMAHVFVSQSQYGNYWVQNFGIDPQRFYELKGYPVEKAKRLPFGKMFK